MTPKFDLNKIKYTTDPKSFQTALELYAKSKVTQFKYKFGAYHAVVLGTQPYEVTVSETDPQMAECKCYIGRNHLFR